MYAVTFDLDTNCLNENGMDLSKVYSDIAKFMEQHGFKWQQGSVYFGDETINAVTCVATVQILAKQIPCFADCVKDVRMLKIEENNDLMPAIKIVFISIALASFDKQDKRISRYLTQSKIIHFSILIESNQ